MNLSGYEASVLAYLAQYPGEFKDEILERLSPIARRVAMVMMGRCIDTDEDVNNVAREIKAWADARMNRGVVAI